MSSPASPAGAEDEPSVPASPWGLMEISAVTFLTLGQVLLFGIGPLLGLALAWSSPRWTRREKGIASVLTLAPLMVIAVLGAALVAARDAGAA